MNLDRVFTGLYPAVTDVKLHHCGFEKARLAPRTQPGAVVEELARGFQAQFHINDLASDVLELPDGLPGLLAGFRAAILVLLGCSHFGGWRFLALDFLATAAWAVLISMIGYTFANVVYIFVSDIKDYEGMIVPLVAVVAVFVILFYRHVVKEKEEEEFYGD